MNPNRLSCDLSDSPARLLRANEQDRLVALLAAGFERYLRAGGRLVDFAADLRVYTDGDEQDDALNG